MTEKIVTIIDGLHVTARQSLHFDEFVFMNNSFDEFILIVRAVKQESEIKYPCLMKCVDTVVFFTEPGVGTVVQTGDERNLTTLYSVGENRSDWVMSCFKPVTL